jgi:hypothetical protein
MFFFSGIFFFMDSWLTHISSLWWPHKLEWGVSSGPLRRCGNCTSASYVLSPSIKLSKGGMKLVLINLTINLDWLKKPLWQWKANIELISGYF